MPGETTIHLFGPPTLEAPGFHSSRFPTRRSVLLLARLALARGQRLGREELCDFLWPDDYHEQSRERLRQELRRLRTAVGPFAASIESDRGQIWIRPGAATTDVARFDAAICSVSAAQALSDRIASLRSALEIVRGPILPGAQEPWVVALRRSYEEKARRAWLALAETYDAAGMADEALDANIGALGHDPLDLESNSLLIRRLVERGQIARARHVYLDYDAALLREMGRRAPDSARTPLAHIWEELDSAKSQPVSRPKPLVGREELVTRILAILDEPGASVVLLGLPGSGKSHLAEEVAWRFSRQFPIPVRMGGTTERVDDGLFVCDERLDAAESCRVIDQAIRNGWRVLACSRIPLGSDACIPIAVTPLETPNEGDASHAIRVSPSVQMLASGLEVGSTPDRQPWNVIGRMASELGGIPAALKAFSRRIAVQSPERLMASMDDALRAFVREPGPKGESFEAGVLESVRGLGCEAERALCRLAVLRETSSELANAIIAPADPADLWPALEERGLLLSSAGRLKIPGPVAWIVRRQCVGHDLSFERHVWQAATEWAYAVSRKPSARKHFDFEILLAELATFRRGLEWCVAHDRPTAVRMIAAIWRTMAARGTPSTDAPALYRAMQSCADSGAAEVIGEAWLGTGLVLERAGQSELAESCFVAAIRTYQEACDVGGWAWASMNYGTIVLLRTDPSRAASVCDIAADETPSWGVRQLARVGQSYALAQCGDPGEAIQIAEQVFSERMRNGDEVDIARAYAELGHLYLLVGRVDAARPLVSAGAQKLRETGIQDLLLECLLDMVQLGEEPDILHRTFEEATAIAERLGSTSSWLEISRARLRFAARAGTDDDYLEATEELFRHTQGTESERERATSLRLLAETLAGRNCCDYANAIREALGDRTDGPVHPGWRSVLGSDSHTTVCVLATVLAKEAITKKGSPHADGELPNAMSEKRQTG